MADLDELLRLLVERKGSDLHLRVGEPPVIRIHGSLERTPYPPLQSDDTRRLVCALLNDERQAIFAERLELDLSHETDYARFRVNVFRQKGEIGAVLRLIPLTTQTLEDLRVPPLLKELSLRSHGLILVTGPTGSGKSTTLAAILDYINTRRRCHILTVEDPIEFMHTDKMAEINQRELGQDTLSFAAALKHVMRQNPDVIMVGEMRDLETIQHAITAAETGHLVFSTVHTTDAPQTIDRLVDVFPSAQQRQIRTQLSTTLLAVLSQTLLPRCDHPGRVAAFELMVATPSIRTLVREGKTHQIASDIQTGGQHGMVSLDHSLLELTRQKLIRYEEALAKSLDPRDFAHRAATLGLVPLHLAPQPISAQSEVF